MGPVLELQKAIRTLLIADATLTSLMGGTPRFYDHVPDEQTFPYIFYEAGLTIEWDTSTEDGWDAHPRIHVYSEVESSKPARDISNRIEALLHNTTALVLTGYTVVMIRRNEHQCFREPDGQVWHSLTSFRALIEEN